MFLQTIMHRNPLLIRTAHELHMHNKIQPDSYVIDVDMLLKNARRILDEAGKNGIRLYYMTKQIGRNPYIAGQLEKMGYSGCVAVDFKDAEIMIRHNLKIGHIGHLVQVPKAKIAEVIRYKPDFITVYSTEKAKEISDAALAAGTVQDIMLRITERDANTYAGQEGGFSLNELYGVVRVLLSCKGIRLSGLTAFPCFLYDERKKTILPTKNTEALLAAKKHIEKQFNISIPYINMPSATSVQNIRLIKEMGGTHGEPGHALTGTTPFNTHEDSAEIPAYIYVSEVSHAFKNVSYFYGGGYYSRGHFEHVLVENDCGQLEEETVNPFSAGNIDYYLELGSVRAVSKTVLGCFRTQMFVTRSDIVLVEGIQNECPSVIGIYTSQGVKKDGTDA